MKNPEQNFNSLIDLSVFPQNVRDYLKLLKEVLDNPNDQSAPKEVVEVYSKNKSTDGLVKATLLLLAKVEKEASLDEEDNKLRKILEKYLQKNSAQAPKKDADFVDSKNKDRSNTNLESIQIGDVELKISDDITGDLFEKIKNKKFGDGTTKLRVKAIYQIENGATLIDVVDENNNKKTISQSEIDPTMKQSAEVTFGDESLNVGDPVPPELAVNMLKFFKKYDSVQKKAGGLSREDLITLFQNGKIVGTTVIKDSPTVIVEIPGVQKFKISQNLLDDMRDSTIEEMLTAQNKRLAGTEKKPQLVSEGGEIIAERITLKMEAIEQELTNLLEITEEEEALAKHLGEEYIPDPDLEQAFERLRITYQQWAEEVKGFKREQVDFGKLARTSEVEYSDKGDHEGHNNKDEEGLGNDDTEEQDEALTNDREGNGNLLGQMKTLQKDLDEAKKNLTLATDELDKRGKRNKDPSGDSE